MTPFEQIEAQYLARPRQEPFFSYIDWHLRHGFVFSRPDFFMMGRPVLRAAPPEMILDPRCLFAREICDTWYLHAAAGNMGQMWAIQPWPLPWFCWTRLHDEQSELIFCSATRLKRLCPPDLSI